ncbi:flavin reductase family protein [Amycolatopsis sp. H20-H5]|uniref:flavin reductase family protein n=1 Tax=Amycolatopsis sp. H20-H5 TaxID=3046309 RepID=UPI002DB95483|nr:flavin reductase family protein [Amycolatopsis sp. H20-H5]MEC3974480.1 flavin reductase family protein [Amycolatopsis sp. H20-H5]
MAPTHPSLGLAVSARAVDSPWFRRVLGHYPTGVTAVTAIGADGRPEAMVVGSFTSVSLDPPLVAFLPSTSSRTWNRIRTAEHFCVNILDAGQERLCRQFAAHHGDKYEGVAWHPAPSGSPIIDGAVAWIDCETDTVHHAGDHEIVVGRVLDLDTAAEGRPLLFFQGGYGSFTPHTLVASDDRFTAELQLIDRARPLLEGTARDVAGQIGVAHCDATTFTMLALAGQARDHRITRAAIGQPVAVAAPIGIWWMSHADPATVEQWLRGTSGARRDHVYEAMRLIRADGGLTVGLSPVHDRLDRLLDERMSGDPRSSAGEAAETHDLAWEPLDFVTSRLTDHATAADHPEIRSIWAPIVDRAGQVVLGVMATGFPTESPLADIARAVHQLAARISSLSTVNAVHRGRQAPPSGDTL